jgi:hypothetical protein
VAGFRFRLERVLDWRRSALSLEQGRLETLRAQSREVENTRRDIAERRLDENRAVAASASVTGQDLARLDALRLWVERQEKLLAARAIELERAIIEQSTRVVSADRDVRLVEKLKERRRAAWNQDQERRIDEAAAESAAASWRRNRPPSVSDKVNSLEKAAFS